MGSRRACIVFSYYYYSCYSFLLIYVQKVQRYIGTGWWWSNYSILYLIDPGRPGARYCHQMQSLSARSDKNVTFNCLSPTLRVCPLTSIGLTMTLPFWFVIDKEYLLICKNIKAFNYQPNSNLKWRRSWVLWNTLLNLIQPLPLHELTTHSSETEFVSELSISIL